MNFVKAILIWILNWILFRQNSNIELIQIGYRPPLLLAHLDGKMDSRCLSLKKTVLDAWYMSSRDEEELMQVHSCSCCPSWCSYLSSQWDTHPLHKACGSVNSLSDAFISLMYLLCSTVGHLDFTDLWKPVNRIRIIMGKLGCTRIQTSSSRRSEKKKDFCNLFFGFWIFCLEA